MRTSNKLCFSALVPLLVLLFSGALLAGQIKGVVQDGTTRDPIPFSHVVLLDQTWGHVAETFTGPDGKFAFNNLVPGTYTYEADHLGQQPGSDISATYGPRIVGNINPVWFTVTDTSTANRNIGIPVNPVSLSIIDDVYQVCPGQNLVVHGKMKNWTNSKQGVQRWGTVTWVDPLYGTERVFPIASKSLTMNPAQEFDFTPYEPFRDDRLWDG